MTTGRLIIGFFLLAIGISALTGFDIFHYIVPFIFIYFGIRLLTGRSWRHGEIKGINVRQDSLNEVLIFSGSEKHLTSADFGGGKVAVIFAGTDIDLSAVKTKSKTVELEVVAVFGGAKVRVPKSWHVTTEGAGIMGGFENRTSGDKDTTCKLVAKGAAIFGGVEIFN